MLVLMTSTVIPVPVYPYACYQAMAVTFPVVNTNATQIVLFPEVAAMLVDWHEIFVLVSLLTTVCCTITEQK
jgi:hypothetical protein